LGIVNWEAFLNFTISFYSVHTVYEEPVIICVSTQQWAMCSDVWFIAACCDCWLVQLNECSFVVSACILLQ